MPSYEQVQQQWGQGQPQQFYVQGGPYAQQYGGGRSGRTPVLRNLAIGAVVVVVGVTVLSHVNGREESQRISLGTTDQGVSFSLIIDNKNHRVWADSTDGRFGDPVVVNADNGQPLRSDVNAALSRMEQATVMVYDYPSCSPSMVTLTYNHSTGRWDGAEKPSSQAPFIQNHLGDASIIENCEIQYSLSRGLTD